MFKKAFLSSALVLSLGVMAACGADDEEGTNGDAEGDSGDDVQEQEFDELVMGFVPSTDSDQIASTVEPLTERLSEELGIEVDGRVMTNYSALVEAMGSGQVQIGFIPAFGYVLANERHDIEVILKSLRAGDDSYRAQYSVRADSGIESLEDLEGKVWAFADSASTSGFLFPATQIRNDFGMTEDEFFGDMVETGSHDNALITVLEGGADVATTFEDAREVIEGDYPEVYDEENGLIQLDFTEPIPNDTISVISELSEDMVNQIREAFLSFNDDEDMIEIMNEVYRWDGIAEAEDSEYDIVREAYDNFSDEVDPLN
ncbi:phosphate/phosphite/phosphonate ABC transporter substrate-binding protein [Alteribacter salitolerans]|uniref:phosphate/phosphite/phosphonate ABC transporter substrate-binding protein n=1 Tax=Alteribacter salitolerans TaxID=2912333 RepID=UPI00234FEFFE|nr:phosphate/phosphite/phosphonate ABC transporter substrate-binding protein [Alteribacter salitolerans]